MAKSLLSLDFAARVSNGTPWPDGEANDVGEVLILSAEDDPDDTIRPRLDALDANVDKVHFLESITCIAEDGQADSRAPTLADVAAVDMWLQRHPDCRLVVIDPISAYLGDTDSHKNAELRSTLAPWATLAADRDVAVVSVSHLTKASGMSPLYRITGSLAFVAAARAVYAVVRDKHDSERRLFLPVKANLGPDTGGLAYRVVPVGDVACIEWEAGAVDIDINDALAPDVPDRERPEHDEAGEFLRDLLGRGPVPVNDIKKEAGAAGIAWRTIERAKSAIGVKSRKRSVGGGWVWQLTHHDHHHDHDHDDDHHHDHDHHGHHGHHDQDRHQDPQSEKRGGLGGLGD